MNQPKIDIYQNRPTRAYIDIDALKNNYALVKSQLKKNIKIMAMVKANAYGHGLLRISQELIKNGADYLGVAYLEEGIFLRKNGIKIPILVVGAINTNQIKDFLKYDIEITSSSFDKSKAISETAKQYNKTAKIHLKIDTGMERIGVHWYNAFDFVKKSYELEKVKIKGLFSHLAKADCDKDFTKIQIERFDLLQDKLKSHNLLPDLIHLANSAGVLNFPESHYNMVRPGLVLYGYNPNGFSPDKKFNVYKIEPVMSLVTKVSYFKVVPENSGISYNHTFTTLQNSRIASLPIGYGDGYFRCFSNKASVIINNHTYPQVGNICMDQMMVDLGNNGTAYNNDDVLLFGKYNNSYLPLEKLCDLISTIPYELTCAISSRVPRIYESSVKSIKN